MDITEKQIEEVLTFYAHAQLRLKAITRGRDSSALSEREYSRAEYWAGKIIGMEDTFEILRIAYRSK